jgi:hypothetical protein
MHHTAVIVNAPVMTQIKYSAEKCNNGLTPYADGTDRTKTFLRIFYDVLRIENLLHWIILLLRKWWIEKDLQGSSRGLAEILLQHLSGGIHENYVKPES